MHGKQSVVSVDNSCKLFKNLADKAAVARYHSLAATKETIPDCLEITAITDDDEVMAVKHKDYEIYGLQFHPESILTKDGKEMLEQFIL